MLSKCSKKRAILPITANRVDGWKDQASLVDAVILHMADLDEQGKQAAASTARQRVASWVRRVAKVKVIRFTDIL